MDGKVLGAGLQHRAKFAVEVLGSLPEVGIDVVCPWSIGDKRHAVGERPVFALAANDRLGVFPDLLHRPAEIPGTGLRAIVELQPAAIQRIWQEHRIDVRIDDDGRIVCLHGIVERGVVRGDLILEKAVAVLLRVGEPLPLQPRLQQTLAVGMTAAAVVGVADVVEAHRLRLWIRLKPLHEPSGSFRAGVRPDKAADAFNEDLCVSGLGFAAETVVPLPPEVGPPPVARIAFCRGRGEPALQLGLKPRLLGRKHLDMRITEWTERNIGHDAEPLRPLDLLRIRTVPGIAAVRGEDIQFRELRRVFVVTDVGEREHLPEPRLTARRRVRRGRCTDGDESDYHQEKSFSKRHFETSPSIRRNRCSARRRCTSNLKLCQA